MGTGPLEISTVVTAVATALSPAAASKAFKDTITHWAQKRRRTSVVLSDSSTVSSPHSIIGDSFSGSFALSVIEDAAQFRGAGNLQISPVNVAKRHVLRRIEEAEQATVQQNVVARTNAGLTTI
jgi:hypothetical protein